MSDSLLGLTSLPYRAIPHCPLVHLTVVPVRELSQRQLLDQLECLQLSWGCVMGAHEHLPLRCEGVLKALMARMVGLLL